MEARIVNLVPSQDAVSFQEAFGGADGEYSDARGRGRRQAKKQARQARKDVRVEAKIARKDRRVSDKIARKTARMDRRAERGSTLGNILTGGVSGVAKRLQNKKRRKSLEKSQEEEPVESQMQEQGYEGGNSEASYEPQEDMGYNQTQESSYNVPEEQEYEEQGGGYEPQSRGRVSGGNSRYDYEEEGNDEGYEEDEISDNEYSEDEYNNMDGEENDVTVGGNIDPEILDTARKIEWNKEYISRLDGDANADEVEEKTKRIMELEGVLSSFSGADGMPTPEVETARAIARRERRAIRKKNRQKRGLGRGRGLKRGLTKVDAKLNPQTSPQRIEIPAEPSSNADGTGLIAIDDKKDIDAVPPRTFNLSWSNASGNESTKNTLITIAIGVGIAGLAIYALKKYKVI